MTRTVSLKGNLDPRWHPVLADALLAIPVASHVGERVKTYLDAVDVVLSLTDENAEHEMILRAAASVVSVWYFG